MKHRYQKNYLVAIALFCSVSFSFAQNGISFQGALYENGEAVNGAVDITFSILSPAWTETHQSVQVVQGLYSVTLGLDNAFPNDLFLTGAPELKISIGGTEIATVDLHAPYISKGIIAQNMPDSINGVFDADASEHNTIIFTVSGTGTGANAAIEAVAQTTDRNTAVEGFSQSEGANTKRQTGVYGQATGDGSGDHRGIVGVAIGGGKYNKGLYGYAEGQGNGDVGQGFGEGSINFGVEGNATGNAFNNTGLEGSNFGESGVWNFGVHGISNAGTDASENHGVAGKAFGPGINYGVHGMASGGVENWAGYFEGDVNVNGNLMLNGSPLAASGEDAIVNNPNGDLRAELSYFDTNDAGSVVLYGANDSTKVIVGTSNGGYTGGMWLYDSLRNVGAQLRVSPDGRGNLYTYNPNHKNVGWYGGLGNDGFAQILSYDDTETYRGGALIGSFADGIYPEFFLEGSAQENFGLARLRTVEVNGEEAGAFELNRSNGGGSFSVNIVSDPNQNDPTGFSSELFMNGTNTPNIQMGGQPWENNDLANLQLFGQTTDGNGWYFTNARLGVSSDGTDDWGDFTLAKSNIAGETSQDMISMSASDGHISATGDISGNTLTSSNGTVQTSDARFKKNVKSIENALSKTSQLNGYTYNWNKLAKKQKGITSDKEQVGVLAQELEEVFPQLVKTDEDGYKAVNYAALTAVLIEAVKELSAEVNSLKAENTKLKSEFSRVASLEAKINLIEKLLTVKNKSDELETASK
ncbi:MAG: tail fiber domain-containing protein [Cyclobacteriaceae bacterium]